LDLGAILITRSIKPTAKPLALFMVQCEMTIDRITAAISDPTRAVSRESNDFITI
jgi:hypothetical protein